MSFIEALNRINQIESRLGLVDSAQWNRQNFETALTNARSNFQNGPARLDTSNTPVSSGGQAEAASRRSSRGVAGSTLPAGAARPGAGGGSATGKVPADLAPIFAQAAARTGVPEALIKAVARAESGFRIDATSPAGAQGIMQLMPGTARGLGVTDSLDPAQNIMGGAKYLKQMLARFKGDVTLALAGYNAGPNAVGRYGGIPPYKETQNYVVKVGDYARQYGLPSMTLPTR
jgi:soluble lytic murein transglycosylase-like protein